MRRLVTGVVLLAAGCQQAPTAAELRAYYEAEGDRLEEATRHVRKAYTFEDFIASDQYRATRDMWRGAALEQFAPAKSHVEILLEEQRGRLYINGTIAMDFPVCSGRVGGKETPTGEFRISQKVREYRSNRYGSFISADGSKVLKSGVSVDDEPPAGAVFEGADMPYWMRFNGAIGLHVGNVHRVGDSHGCVRVPEEACSILFEKLSIGSKVIVK